MNEMTETNGAGAAPLTARDRHLFGPGPKRIVSPEGGGVRGALSLAFLKRLEETIEEIEGRPTLLCDWFDLIGGTSTGAIIATALALGYRADDIRNFCYKLGPAVFRRSRWRVSGLLAKFDARRLLQQIGSIIGDRTPDSEDLRNSLCILTKRMDTGSVWMVINNPKSQFWNSPVNGSFTGNRHYSLVNLVRASTAAPYYFDPESISIVPGMKPGVFVDGGVSPHNNPALQLFLAAALPQFQLCWPLGPENLSIVSVGTGSFRPIISPDKRSWVQKVHVTLNAQISQISDSEQLILSLMSLLGDSPVPWVINSEYDDLGQSVPPGAQPFSCFLRYDVRLEKHWLKRKLIVEFADRTLASYRRLDQPASIPALYSLGAQAAQKQIRKEHFTVHA